MPAKHFFKNLKTALREVLFWRGLWQLLGVGKYVPIWGSVLMSAALTVWARLSGISAPWLVFIALATFVLLLLLFVIIWRALHPLYPTVSVTQSNDPDIIIEWSSERGYYDSIKFKNISKSTALNIVLGEFSWRDLEWNNPTEIQSVDPGSSHQSVQQFLFFQRTSTNSSQVGYMRDVLRSGFHRSPLSLSVAFRDAKHVRFIRTFFLRLSSDQNHVMVELGPLEIEWPVLDLDPRVIVSMVNTERDIGHLYEPVARLLILNNRGKQDAFNVRMQPIILGSGSAEFSALTILAPDRDTTIRPEVSAPFSRGPLQQRLNGHNFEKLLHAEWDGENDLSLDTISVPFRILYDDHSRRWQFCTEGLFVYHPHGGAIEVTDLRFSKRRR